MDLSVEIDHGQVYVYSAEPWADGDEGYDSYLLALDDAQRSGRYVGVSMGLIDLVTPVRWNDDAPFTLEFWAAEPDDDDLWDHVVDVDFDIAGDRIRFRGSGGCEPKDFAAPTGRYRARVSGRGYDLAGVERVRGADWYRMQLWPRTVDSPPVLRKRWAGWDEHA